MRWRADQIVVEISDAEGIVVEVKITTPRCTVEMIGEVSRVGRVLHLRRVHIQGASAGSLGRAGLNAIARKLLVEADVDEVVIEGGSRTTGRMAGQIPRAIRYPRSFRTSDDS